MTSKTAILAFAFFGTVFCNPIPWYFLQYPEEGTYFEGDILENPNTISRAGINNENARWPDKTLVYNIATGFTADEQSLIRKAMEEISTRTCLKFRPGSSGDYVEFVKGTSGCSSNVGRVGGRQPINLATACFNVGHGTVMHEMIHAFGFFHEQSRSDRDSSVKIRYEFIQFWTWTNFQRQSNSLNYGVPYDYESIMHYPRNAFAYFPTLTTIEPEEPRALNLMGQRKTLSPLDIQKLSRMYSC